MCGNGEGGRGLVVRPGWEREVREISDWIGPRYEGLVSGEGICEGCYRGASWTSRRGEGDIYAVGTWKGQKRQGGVGGWRAVWEREWVRGLMDGWRRSGVGDVARSRWQEQREGRRWEGRRWGGGKREGENDMSRFAGSAEAG